MKFECPNCKLLGHIEDTRVPADGLYANCPKCKTKFLVKQEVLKDFTFTQVKIDPSEKDSLKNLAETSQKQKTVQNHSSIAPLQGNPWRRFWARMLDTFFIGFPVSYVIGLKYPDIITSIVERSGGVVEATFPLFIITLPFILLFEASMIGNSGTTFGKWLLNISIVSKDNGRDLSMLEAVKRAILLWIKGLACGLPLINLITMGFAAIKIKKNITASWDDSVSADVRCEELEAWKVILAVFSIVGFLILSGMLQNSSKETISQLNYTPTSMPPPAPTIVTPDTTMAPPAPTAVPNDTSALVTQTQEMKTYTVTDPATGQVIKMKSRTLPTEAEIDQAFAAQARTTVMGRVLQIMDTTSYSYVQVEEKGQELWIAVPKESLVKEGVKVGDTIECSDSPPIFNFQSKELKKNFDKAIFAADLRKVK